MDFFSAARTYALLAVRRCAWRSGRPDRGEAAFAEALTGVLPPWQFEGLVEDYAHYARGEAGEVHTSVEDLTGPPA